MGFIPAFKKPQIIGFFRAQQKQFKERRAYTLKPAYVPSLKHGAYILLLVLLACLRANGQNDQSSLLKKANDLFEQGAYAKANPSFAQLLSLDPTNPEYSYKYGATALYGDPKKREEAIKYLRYASGKSGVDPEVWFFLGRAYHLNYQFRDALSAYERYNGLAAKKQAEKWQVDRAIEMASNGKDLLSSIKEVRVLDKKNSREAEFFRLYDLSDIGGKILVTPEELLSSLDKKRKHRSLIHYQGEGSRVYFSSYGKNGENGLDIYSADVLPGGSFSEPTRLPETINTPYDEDFPYMHPDGRSFYFSSKGHNSMGGYDIFRSGYDPASGFAAPQNLDFAVNTPDDDIFYIVDSQYKLANFASARSSRQGDLHVYRVEVAMAPMNLVLVKGTFENLISTTQRSLKIEVRDAATDQVLGEQFSDPATGDYLLHFPKGGRYKLHVEVQGREQTHSTVVDIPAADGMTAYLQEMELMESGAIEKLRINNRFDEMYQGDVAALSAEVLRRQAELEVNWHQMPGEEEAPTAPDGDEDVLAKAYSKAGFGAGMSNEMVLEKAQKRRDTRAAQLDRLLEDSLIAASSLQEAWEKANTQWVQAQSLKDQAGNDDGEKAFEASLAQWEADQALHDAEVAASLIELLQKEIKVERQKLQDENEHVQGMEQALAGNAYEEVLAAMEAEYERKQAYDMVAERVDMRSDLGVSAKESREKATDAMIRARKMRAQQERLISDRKRKLDQLTKLKGKQAKSLEEEIARLDQEIEELQSTVSRAYKRAEEYERDASLADERYELYAGIRKGDDLLVSLPEPLTSSEEVELRQITSLRKELSAFEVDRQVAEAYLLSNPQALAELGEESDIRSFHKLTGIGVHSAEEAIAMQQDNNLSSKPIDMSEAGAVTEEAGGQLTSPDQMDGEAYDEWLLAVADDKELPGGISRAPEPKLPETANADEQPVLEESPMDRDAKPKQELETAPSESGSEYIPAAIQPDMEQSESVSLSDDPLNAATPGSKGQSIEEAQRQEELQAARDWLGIIEESMASLPANPEDDSPEEAEQRADYLRLWQEKNEEIEQMQLSVPAVASSDESLSAKREDALLRSRLDIDALEPAYISRLESKINEVNVVPRYTATIASIDETFLEDLAELELSGKSAPEIATERIKRNEELIVAIDHKLMTGDNDPLQMEMLVEVKRIKEMEIRQDRDVSRGQLPYEARSAEALAYKNMLEAVDDEEQSTGDGVDTTSLLSPELQEALRKPYRWDDVLPGYTSLNELELDEESDADLVSARIDAHKKMLRGIKKDIDLYSLTLSEQGDNPDAALKQRYEQLLGERSYIVDLLQADEQLKVRIEIVEQAGMTADEISDLREEAVEQKAEARSNTRPDLGLASIDEQIDQLKTRLQEELKDRQIELEENDLSETDRMNILAEANASAAAKYQEKVEDLALQLDATFDDEVLSALQIRIQELDALSADHMQEADRLKLQAEEAALEAGLHGAEQEMEAASDLDLIGDLPEEPQFEDLRIASVAPVQIEEYAFRSLQANMDRANLNELANRSVALRQEAAESMEAYSEAGSPQERREQYDRLQQLSREIEKADHALNESVAKANKAETEFFAQSASALLQGSDDMPIEEDERAQLANLNTQIGALMEGVDVLRDQKIELDPADTKAYSQILNSEMQVIAQIDSLHQLMEQEMAAIKERLDAKAAIAQDTEMSDDTVERIEEPADIKPIIPALDREADPVVEGRVHLTAGLEELGEKMDAERRERLESTEPLLSLELPLDSKNDREKQLELVEAGTRIDRFGLELLASTPVQLNYLSAVIVTDSLRKMETALAASVEQKRSNASMRHKESLRLQTLASSESDESKRNEILSRASAMNAEVQGDLEEAYLVAQRADELHTRRSEMENELEAMRSNMDAAEVAALDSLLRTGSDRRDEMVAAIEADAEKDAGEEPLAESSEPSEPDMAAPVSDASAKTDSPRQISDDGKVSAAGLAENFEGGNWLAMVEVIAEKEDFSDVKEELFLVADRQVYSDRRPIPLDPQMPDGLIFQVQVGAFRNPIPQGHFGAIAPLMGQKLPNGITRYRAGIFKVYSKALEARNTIREMGYRDAFVVAYLDGEKLTGAQARDILAQAQRAEAESTAPRSSQRRDDLVAEEVQPTGAQQSQVTQDEQEARQPQVPDYYSDPDAAEAVQVEAVRGLFYTVQVGVYSKPVKLEALYNLRDLNSELTESGLIRYTTGRFTDVALASQRKDEARGAGVKDAFVTVYFDGKRINLREAEELIRSRGEAVLARFGESLALDDTSTKSPENVDKQESPSSPSASSDKSIRYVVILGSFSADVPQNVANFSLQRSDLGVRLIRAEDGTRTYASPEYTERRLAQNFLRLAQEAGLETAELRKVEQGQIKALEDD